MATVITPGSGWTHYALDNAFAPGDNAIAIQTDDVSRFKVFELFCTQGTVDVFVSLDGSTYVAAALSLIDLGATAVDPVIEGVANRLYGFRGVFRKIRVLQKGATAILGAQLLAGNLDQPA